MANHQLAGQTPSSTSAVKIGAQRNRNAKPNAAISSATPEMTISSITNGVHSGINQRNALGFTR